MRSLTLCTLCLLLPLFALMGCDGDEPPRRSPDAVAGDAAPADAALIDAASFDAAPPDAAPDAAPPDAAPDAAPPDAAPDQAPGDAGPQGLRLALGAPAYALAQACVTVEALPDGRALAVAGDAAYTFAEAANAEPFFPKPSALGAFLLHDRGGRLLAAQGDAVVRQSAADARAVWTLRDAELSLDGALIRAGRVLSAQASGARLILDAAGAPALASAEAAPDAETPLFRLAPRPAADCLEFPEAELSAERGEGFGPPGDPAAPIVGFADPHVHLALPKAMAGVAVAGEVFHPWGVEHALADCADIHGEDGTRDFLETEAAGEARHATDGCPSFSYWPTRHTRTHTQAYYRWLERAYLSGLRLVVTHVTGNPTFCEILTVLNGGGEGGCNGLEAVAQQTAYIYAIQDYVDAQWGGPGQGWFRVVTSPAQARAAIARSQLAVVLGVEHGELFDCRASNAGCTPEYVDAQLDALHQLGIRVVFPIHRFDNAFGGTRPGGGTGDGFMHLTSKISTSTIDNIVVTVLALPERIGGFFWDIVPCEEGVSGSAGVMDMRRFMAEEFQLLRDVAEATLGPFLADRLDAFVEALEPIPSYPEFQNGERACNRRPLQPIGAHLIHGLIDRGMIIEIDHLSHATFTQVLELLEARAYPGFISSHSWFEDNPATRARIFALGGLISPMKGAPSQSARKILTLRAEQQAHGLPAGVPVSTDIQGVTSQAPADADVALDYPFPSVDGTVRFTRPRAGERTFDYRTEGVAHYGLLAEWVENLRQVDANAGTDALAAFMSSAEAYVQLWERASATLGD